MIAHMSYVMCDRCGNPAGIADEYKEARAIAKRQGYRRVVVDGAVADLCKACRVAVTDRDLGLETST